MKCRNCENNLSAYLDGELPGRLRARIEAHLTECASCRAALEALKSTDKALDALGDLEPVSDFTERVLRRLDSDGVRATPIRSLGWRVAAAGAVAACLTVAVLATLSLATRQSTSAPPETLVAEAEIDLLDQMEMLADLEVIENLDALEAMDDIEGLEEFLTEMEDFSETGS